METFSASLALCEGNPPVTGGLPSQRPMTWGFDVFFDLRLNTRLIKQSRHRWTSSRSLWRPCNVWTSVNTSTTINIPFSVPYNLPTFSYTCHLYDEPDIRIISWHSNVECMSVHWIVFTQMLLCYWNLCSIQIAIPLNTQCVTKHDKTVCA